MAPEIYVAGFVATLVCYLAAALLRSRQQGITGRRFGWVDVAVGQAAALIWPLTVALLVVGGVLWVVTWLGDAVEERWAK